MGQSVKFNYSCSILCRTHCTTSQLTDPSRWTRRDEVGVSPRYPSGSLGVIQTYHAGWLRAAEIYRGAIPLIVRSVLRYRTETHWGPFPGSADREKSVFYAVVYKSATIPSPLPGCPVGGFETGGQAYRSIAIVRISFGRSLGGGLGCEPLVYQVGLQRFV